MATPTQVRMDYEIVANPPVTKPRLETACAAIQLAGLRDIPEGIGCKFVSDNTVTTVDGVKRSITYSLFPTPNLYEVVTPSIANYAGSIASSSLDDVDGGEGLRCARVHYVNDKGQPDFEDVNLAGPRPVPMLKWNKIAITRIESFRVGTLGAAQGLVTVYTGTVTGGTLGPFTQQGDRAAEVIGNFTGFALSTSDEDRVGGTGSTHLRITYEDKDGFGPFTEDVALSGQVPVPLLNADHARILSIATLSTGSAGGNLGTLSVYTGISDGTAWGAPAAALPPSFPAYFPVDSDQKGPFRDLFTHRLASALACKVIADEPVLSS